MDVIHKDATITNTDTEFPGAFEVILSAPTLDRDGDTLKPDEWKMPLPDHITFDSDHGMSVATTVGSGAPRIDEGTGNLIVSGSYSSLPRAQEVRTLVNEGHIRTTSVAFMSDKTQKDGKTVATRELLNGAFVAIPSNREALVLASKALKAGARNSKSDAAMIQTVHDHAVTLGAECPAIEPKSFGTAETNTDDGSAVTLSGDATPVDLTEVVKPDPDEDQSTDPAVAPAAAPAKAAAPAETTAAEADAIRLRVQALNLSVSTYAD